MNAVIYARYSSDKQTEQSIDGQLRYCTEYATHEGYNIVGTYIDRAITGTNDRRPEFQKMIADSYKNAFQYIIVWKLDRFSRNRYDSALYKVKLKKNGVRVISATEPIGDGNESIIMEAMLEAMAEVYSKQLAENVTRGMKETALKGLTTGGTLPLGYFRGDDRKLHINEVQAAAVRTAFEMYADGKTKKEIVNYLNKNGYVSKTGKPFVINSFNNMLECRYYIGEYAFRGGEIIRACPPIISVELFEQVQKRLADNKRVFGKKVVENVHYLLSGKLFCGMCGEKMIGDSGTSKTGVKHYYYTCKGRKKHSCKKAREKKDFIEWYVVEQTVEYVLTESRIDYIAERVVEEYNKDSGTENIKQLERQLKQIDNEFDRCVDNLIATTSKVIIDKINKKSERLEIQKEDIEIKLAELRVTQQIALTVDDVKKWLRSFCKGDLFDMKFRERIIDTFINSVYLWDDKVTIYYNIKDGKQISYIEALSDIDNVESGGCSDSISQSPPSERQHPIRGVAVFCVYSLGLDGWPPVNVRIALSNTYTRHSSMLFPFILAIS